jgi:hypothetical protein
MTRTRSQSTTRPGVLSQDTGGGIEVAPRANATGSLFCLVALLITAVSLSGNTATEVARHGAIGVGIGLAISLLFDARRGFRNLIRADVMALLALYFLTLFEFHFPQIDFDEMLEAASARNAVIITIWGFAGIVLGRHFTNLRAHPFRETFTHPVPRSWLIGLFWICFVIGYFHMLLAVDFNPLLMTAYFTSPRFTQPWGRGKFGDWKALMTELGMLLNLIPPLAGIILARRKTFPKFQLLLVTLGFLYTLFYGFAGGTRNVFASFLVTFLIGYSFAMEPNRRKELVGLSVVCAALLGASTVLMLKFREVGLYNYVRGVNIPLESKQYTLFVDYNLYAIARLAEVFPVEKDFVGWEIPYLAIIRPIPRALWPGKPEGISMSIEDALGVEGLTVAASFIGEAYMAGGTVVVIITALFFGMITGWWSHLASPRNSELGILIYASGFFAAVISMRSLFVFTTAMLPTLAALMLTSLLVRKLSQLRRAQTARAVPSRRVPERRRL